MWLQHGGMCCTYLSAYLSVFNVWSLLDWLGDIVAIIHVFELPTNESLNTIVSLLPRKGACPLSWSSARMHSLSANKLLLISAPSSLVFVSVLRPRSDPLSLPAKSIKLILPWMAEFRFLSRICSTACERDELSFVCVLEVLRSRLPNSNTCLRVVREWIRCSLSPVITILPLPSSRGISFRRLFSRSSSCPW